MMLSFYDDTQYEIKKTKEKLLKKISQANNTDIENDTELYSNFITEVGKLSGKIEGLELSIKIYAKYHRENTNISSDIETQSKFRLFLSKFKF